MRASSAKDKAPSVKKAEAVKVDEKDADSAKYYATVRRAPRLRRPPAPGAFASLAPSRLGSTRGYVAAGR